jgi:phage major head subunit gpT-like protein
MLVKDLVARFNVVARTEYIKTYKSFDPKFSGLMFEYQSGAVASVDFPFVGFLRNMEEFNGTRTHQTFPEGHYFTVTNKEWDMAVDIRARHMKRAAQSTGIAGLDMYRRRIAEMPKMIKDHPIELAFDMMEAGAASTYGTCFDGQNLYDTTHDYSDSAGTQNNIYTGTGVTAATLHADILGVIARFQSFYYNQQMENGTTKKRKLNDGMAKPLIVAPVELHGVLFDLQTKATLATGETNSLQGRFDFTTKHFTDTNDWYANLIDDPIFKPFLYQVEEYPVLDMPTPQDESYRERDVYSYGARGSYNVAYGAWWKTIKVTNA